MDISGIVSTAAAVAPIVPQWLDVVRETTTYADNMNTLLGEATDLGNRIYEIMRSSKLFTGHNAFVEDLIHKLPESKAEAVRQNIEIFEHKSFEIYRVRIKLIASVKEVCESNVPLNHIETKEMMMSLKNTGPFHREYAEALWKLGHK
jgi:hypothetical protein